MKVIFCGFGVFFANSAKAPDRKGANVTDLRKKIGSSVAKGQYKLRKQQEINGRAAEKSGNEIETDLPVPGRDDIEKKADGDEKPEQQVQQRPQQAEVYPDPQDAEQVIDHADGQPQDQRPHKGGGLVSHVDLHVSGTAGPAAPAFRPGPPHRSENR